MLRALLLAGAAVPAASTPSTPYAFGAILRGQVEMNALLFFNTTIPSDAPAVKISIVPLQGDADVFLSFEPFSEMAEASFHMDETGPDEMLLRRSATEWTCAAGKSCALYFAIWGYSTSDFLFRLSAFADEEGGTGTSALDTECSPGCSNFDLSDATCHLDCNTTACMYDGGDCLLEDEYCSVGCPLAWRSDELCDEACFTPECGWDGAACFEGFPGLTEGCAPKCLPRWIDDGMCDEECNNAACGWDGSDCYHGHDSCWYEADGADYRGTANRTKSGKACQAWSAQFPHQHTRTARWYPDAGLGGHNFCRNPDGEAGPWCYTTDAASRWELCDVPSTAGTSVCPPRLPQPDASAGELAALPDGACPNGTTTVRTGICGPCSVCAEGMEERIKCSTDYDRICAPACASATSTRFDSQGKGALAMVQALCAYGAYNRTSVASFDAKRLCSSVCCHAFELASGACDYDGLHLATWHDIKSNLALGHEALCKAPVDACPVFAAAKADARGDKSSDGGWAPSGARGLPARGGGRPGAPDKVTTSEAMSNPFILTVLSLGGAAVVALCLALLWYRRRVKRTLLYASPNAPDPEEMQGVPPQ